MPPPTGRIDLHSHLLPGIDDGCPTIADSITCASALTELGYTHACCTPHVWPSLPRNNPARITYAVDELQRHLRAASVPLTLVSGGELNLRAEAAEFQEEQLVTYAMAGRFLLFDLWAERLPSFFNDAVQHLQSFGVTLILAHPERMRAVQEDPMLAEFFNERGILLQGNLQCFADPPSSATRRTAERLFDQGRYHVLGSDTHNFETMAVRLEGFKRVRQMAGDAMLDELTIHRPRLIIGANQIVDNS